MNESGEIQASSRLTLDPGKALDLAIWLHQTGRLQEADHVYRALLTIDPYHADAMNYLGVLCHQLGRTEDSLILLRASLENDPRSAHAWNNLGNVLRETGDKTGAIEAYRKAGEMDPGNAAAHNNLGVALKELDRLAESELAYRRALEADPEHADAWRNLGHVLTRLSRPVEALDAYSRAVALRPEGAPYRNLSYSLYRLGQTQRAIAVVQDWLAREPDNPVARHLLAAFSGEKVPVRASDEFVREVFSGFARTYDDKLRHLQYRGPEIVASALARTLGSPPRQLRILDAGCGTGLCAPILRPWAAHLTGLDLSPEMLAFARAGGSYDVLVDAELTGYLKAQQEAFDLIVSADTLCYFGDLGPVVGGAAEASRPGGLLLFTLEDAGDGETGAGFRLEPHGRYSHREGYVREVLLRAGFAVKDLSREKLRMEAGEPVTGLVVAALKPS